MRCQNRPQEHLKKTCLTAYFLRSLRSEFKCIRTLIFAIHPSTVVKEKKKSTNQVLEVASIKRSSPAYTGVNYNSIRTFHSFPLYLIFNGNIVQHRVCVCQRRPLWFSFFYPAQQAVHVYWNGCNLIYVRVRVIRVLLCIPVDFDTLQTGKMLNGNKSKRMMNTFRLAAHTTTMLFNH